MTNETSSYSYDQVTYPGSAYPQTYPDHLATLATLSGMRPPSVARCRVLELGCASGSNLIPMAYSLPGSDFVGIDLSARQIAEGRAAIETLGLKNISLEQMDILELEADFGLFDYVIVYGIYSWVPPEVRARILEICRRNLAPNGVAYVSYNVYPGWHMFSIVRDAMLYHAGQRAEPQLRIDQARMMLKFMVATAENSTAEHDVYGQFLKKMEAFLEPLEDSYLFHDFMEEVNAPLYFHQFIEQAQRHGLQYLANAEFSAPRHIPAEASEILFDLTEDIIEIEQYMDFLNNRSFRETALCHQGIALDRTLKPDSLATLMVASNVRPTNPEPDLHSTGVEDFRAFDGATVSTAHPLTKAALLYLAERFPRAIPFEALLAEAQAKLGSDAAPSPQEAQTLATNLLTAYSHSLSLVELHSHSPHFVLEAGERPVASAAARFQVEHNLPVTNLYHRRVNVGPVPRHLLPLLDGRRDRAALLESLLALEADGTLQVHQDDQVVREPEQVRRIVAQDLEAQLDQMARTALLVG